MFGLLTWFWLVFLTFWLMTSDSWSVAPPDSHAEAAQSPGLTSLHSSPQRKKTPLCLLLYCELQKPLAVGCTSHMVVLCSPQYLKRCLSKTAEVESYNGTTTLSAGTTTLTPFPAAIWFISESELARNRISRLPIIQVKCQEKSYKLCLSTRSLRFAIFSAE